MPSFSYFEDDPLPYNPDPQLSMNFFDPFHYIGSDNNWTESTESHPAPYTAPVVEDLFLYTPSITEDQNARMEPTKEGAELRQVIQNLQERIERIEKMMESLHNE
jgi:hypothetical protein